MNIVKNFDENCKQLLLNYGFENPSFFNDKRTYKYYGGDTGRSITIKFSSVSPIHLLTVPIYDLDTIHSNDVMEIIYFMLNDIIDKNFSKYIDIIGIVDYEHFNSDFLTLITFEFIFNENALKNTLSKMSSNGRSQ